MYTYAHTCNSTSICMCVYIYVLDSTPQSAVPGVSLNSQQLAYLSLRALCLHNNNVKIIE